VRVEELNGAHRAMAAALWRDGGLTRPWNDPLNDFDRAIAGPASVVLGIVEGGDLVGTAMTGHDGHRGWVYYLCVATAHQRRGLGVELMRAAEEWLRARGAVKVQVMVRHTNQSVVTFYESIGYEASDVTVLARWL
jgi:ribosomal protein S18 acetylase RimI-like enzyme